jgi:hypothetical protein
MGPRLPSPLGPWHKPQLFRNNLSPCARSAGVVGRGLGGSAAKTAKAGRKSRDASRTAKAYDILGTLIIKSVNEAALQSFAARIEKSQIDGSSAG